MRLALSDYPIMRKRCRHCGARRASRSRRQLCAGCYFDPTIRALYPDRRPWSGIDLNQRPKPARLPTFAKPGSEEKIEVMEERFQNDEAVFHDDDYKKPCT